MTDSEKILRDRLYNMEVPYPDDMWGRIAANLPEEKDNKKLWLFFLIFLLALVVPGSMYWFNNQPSTQVDSSASTTALEVTESYTELNSESNNSQSFLSDNDPKEKVVFSLNNLEKEENTSLKTVTPTNIKALIKQEPVRNVTDAKISSVAIQSIEEEKYESETNSKEIKKRALISSYPRLPSLASFLLTEDYNFVPPECPTFSLQGSQGMYIDIYYSHDYALKQMEAKSQEFSPYVTERENTESGLYSFSAGVRISYISSSGLGVKTGFNYSQINEKFKYLDPDASLIRTIITIDTLIVGGVPTVISDTSTIRIPGSLDITTYNNYKFFDIPILLTYESYLTDKMYYTLNGGALINLTFSQKGRFLDPGGQPVWFTSTDAGSYDAYKTSAGISLFGSIGLHYYLTPHLDLILEPNFKLYTGSLTNDAYPLKQKWLTGGLITGIRYKF